MYEWCVLFSHHPHTSGDAPTNAPDSLLDETECRVVGGPAVAQPEPAHPNLAKANGQEWHSHSSVLALKDVAAFNDRTPQIHRIFPEQLAEHGDALLLNRDTVLQVEAGGESSTALTQRVVDGISGDSGTDLAAVTPLVDLVMQVVLNGPAEFQSGVHYLLHPRWIARLDRSVHSDHEVELGFGQRVGIGADFSELPAVGHT